jgi:hypothetical protein
MRKVRIPAWTNSPVDWSNLALGFALRLWLTLSQQRPLHRARPAGQPHADRQGRGGGRLFGNVDRALTAVPSIMGSIVFWTFQPTFKHGNTCSHLLRKTLRPFHPQSLFFAFVLER